MTRRANNRLRSAKALAERACSAVAIIAIAVWLQPAPLLAQSSSGALTISSTKPAPLWEHA